MYLVHLRPKNWTLLNAQIGSGNHPTHLLFNILIFQTWVN